MNIHCARSDREQVEFLSPNKRRGRILSLYGIIFLAANGVAQPLLGVFTPREYSLFGITSILISMCVLPVGLDQVKGNPQVSSITILLGDKFSKSPMGSTGVIISGLVSRAHITLTPRAVQSWGLSDGAIGLFLLIVTAETIALQLPWAGSRTTKNGASYC